MLDQILLPVIREVAEPEEESLLFCDNLDAQIQPEFLAKLETVNCCRNLSPAECTDQVQAIDAGFGRQLKVEVGNEYEEWLEDDDNLDKWENGKLSASDKRIMVTTWVGAT